MTAPPRPLFKTKRKALRGQVIQQIDMVDVLPDPLIQITSKRGRVKWANRAALALFGAEVIGTRLLRALPSPQLRTALKRLKAAESQQLDLYFRSKRFPGQDFQARLVRLEKKTAYGARVLISLSDVTEIFRLQAQRADFIANASHELKTPVAALSGFIETLSGFGAKDPKALEQFLPLMEQEAARMRDLIDDLLHLSRVELEEADTPAELIDPQPLIDLAVSGLSNKIAQRGQRLITAPFATPVHVRGDAIALRTVFTNLLENAATYAPSISEISIETEISAGEIQIHFRNEGPGIAKEHLPRLTERFYRADPARSAGRGTGLGLAIVKHALIRHGGRLDIRSEPGQGACFSVVLPRALSTSNPKL